MNRVSIHKLRQVFAKQSVNGRTLHQMFGPSSDQLVDSRGVSEVARAVGDKFLSGFAIEKFIDLPVNYLVDNLTSQMLHVLLAF